MVEKRRELTEFERGKIVGAHCAGVSLGGIAELFSMPRSTVQTVIKKYNEYGLTKPLPRSGRPPKFSEDDISHLVEIVEENHLASLAEITAQMRAFTMDDLSESTVKLALHKEGYYGRVGLRKPFISEGNRQKRLSWAQERLSWKKEWNFIIWSDESRYVLNGSKRRKYVWRRPEQKMDVNCLVPTFKRSQKSVMVWGCFTRLGLGPLVRLKGRLAAKDYIKVLEDNLLPFLESLKRRKRFTFQEDNAPIHTAKKSARWKEENSLPCFPWPAQSPDLNPIEHLWDELERRLRLRVKPPKNEDELFQFLEEEWKKIPLLVIEKLVDSMGDRVRAVYEADGYPTRY